MYLRLPVPTAVPPRGGGGGRVADFEEPCIAWRKSTASDSGGCVEVAVVDGWVLIRDSANPYGIALKLLPAAWSAFIARARRNDFGPGETCR
jgi:hypothetical protein